jgi:hypothetical protein
MKRVKTKIKRPLILYAIIVIYVLAPLGNLLLIRVFFSVSVSAVLSHVYKGYGVLAGTWLLTAPLVGIGFYFVMKASWYAFLAHSTLILADYIFKWARAPLLYWQSISGPHNLLLLTGNLLLVFVIGYIVQKNFRAPYFQALPRSWRESVRLPIIHRVMIDGTPARIDDLSSGGCFAPGIFAAQKAGDIVSIGFTIETVRVDCKGEIRRQGPDGIGIQFLSLPRGVKRRLGRVLAHRFALRYEARIPFWCLFGDGAVKGEILNISRGGCYMHASGSGVEVGGIGEVQLALAGKAFRVPARVVWTNRSGEHEKPEGFGVRFLHPQGKLMKRLIGSSGRSALTR